MSVTLILIQNNNITIISLKNHKQSNSIITRNENDHLPITSKIAEVAARAKLVKVTSAHIY
jgi:hypothetical protein